jgi:hypothetical protein
MGAWSDRGLLIGGMLVAALLSCAGLYWLISLAYHGLFH